MAVNKVEPPGWFLPWRSRAITILFPSYSWLLGISPSLLQVHRSIYIFYEYFIEHVYVV